MKIKKPKMKHLELISDVWTKVGHKFINTRVYNKLMARETFEQKVLRSLGEIKTNIKVLQTDMKTVKTNIKVLQTDMKVVKSDIKVLQTDMKVVKSDIKDMKNTPTMKKELAEVTK